MASIILYGCDSTTATMLEAEGVEVIYADGNPPTGYSHTDIREFTVEFSVCEVQVPNYPDIPRREPQQWPRPMQFKPSSQVAGVHRQIRHLMGPGCRGGLK